MSKATRDSMMDLQDVFAEVLRGKLESGDATSQDLSVIRQFLKDHGIDLHHTEEVDRLEQALAETEDAELPENVLKMGRNG